MKQQRPLASMSGRLTRLNRPLVPSARPDEEIPTENQTGLKTHFKTKFDYSDSEREAATQPAW